ncbi:MAG: 1-deoxy-D-xylulose-5-phosphate reductoisomerase [Verrucomicrobiae bacterium]|nr:1-deoxy-D-xylulose-5-phosphate reductoisomerase [Verrucomicrobiae bacterium]
MQKKVVILGSTGSIGTSSLKVARDIPHRMKVVGLAGGKNRELLLKQAQEFSPALISVMSQEDAQWLESRVPNGMKVVWGEEGLIQLAELAEANLVIVAIVGTGGLKPALTAVRAGKDIAVASKEILVMAGQVVMPLAKAKGVKVLPVDSEHNAIFQCLEGRKVEEVRRIILTASGGPFLETPLEHFPMLTKAQALKHPTWVMGQKITIDSATLFNKGLEMIEARWLFDLPMEKVDVVVHQQSIIHSMVEFVDCSILAQLSYSDMCFPIQYAVTYPERLKNSLAPLDFTKVRALTFEAPDEKRFPALRLARQADAKGGTMPAVLNAANEVAVQHFLEERLSFPGIWEVVEKVMESHKEVASPDLKAILQADQEARRIAEEILKEVK